METYGALSTPARQPLPAQPFPAIPELLLPTPEDVNADPRVTYVGRLRVPLAGPYRPWARLYRLPDRRLVWVVRLWDRDRAVRRVVSTRTLLEFARMNDLPAWAARVRGLDRRGRSGA
jgi:hypothetical protein